MPEKFVVYMVTQDQKGNSHILFSQTNLAENRLQDFIKKHNDCLPLKTFTESMSNARKNHWPELTQAVDYCLNNQAHLILSDMRNYPSNETYAKEILRLISQDAFTAKIYCLDQPLINADNFAVLAEHFKQQKIQHGELIKAGLQRTLAKSGNPRANEILSKVNKPKIDHAITFALLLQPVIAEYQTKGLSQRKMVTALNEAGFMAPEGGPWVLSQLQKVIDRMKVNDCALKLEKKFADYQAQGLDLAGIAQALNEAKIPTFKENEWTSEMVKKVQERAKQIRDIIEFHDFVIKLSPIFEKYNSEELTDHLFKQELQTMGIDYQKVVGG